MAAVVMPVGLLNGAVLVMAGVQAMRLSVRLSRQLLPVAAGGDTTGGLWTEFRLYSLRFLLCLVGAFAVGLLDILLRTLCGGILP